MSESGGDSSIARFDDISENPFCIRILNDGSEDGKKIFKLLVESLSGSLTPRQRSLQQFLVITKSDLDTAQKKFQNKSMREALKSYCLLESSTKESSTGVVETELPSSDWVGRLNPEELKDIQNASDQNLKESSSRIYLLVDYPSTATQMSEFLSENDCDLVDGIVELLPTAEETVLQIHNPVASCALDSETRETDEQKTDQNSTEQDLPDMSDESSFLETKIGSAAEDDIDFANELENDVSLHSRQPSCDTNKNVIQEFKKAANSDGFKWSDLTFSCISYKNKDGDNKSISDLVQDLKELLTTLAAEKTLFKKWLRTSKRITVPYELNSECNRKQRLRSLKKEYNDSLAPVFEASVSPAVIIYAIREAVATLAGEAPIINNTDAPSYVNIDYCDPSAMRVSKSESLYQTRSTKSGNPSTFLGVPIDSIEKLMWGNINVAGVGHGGRKGMPKTPELSAQERGLRDTELQSSSTLMAVEELHLTKMLLIAEKMLQDNDPGGKWKGKVLCREFYEELSTTQLPQRLSEVLQGNPRVYSHYYAERDALLIAAHTPTAFRRASCKTWSAKELLRHRPCFKDWRYEKPPEFMSPRMIDARESYIDISPSELDATTFQEHLLYPSDHNVIRVRDCGIKGSWISVLTPWNDIFGLRQVPETLGAVFRVAFSDFSQVVVSTDSTITGKPDGHGTVVATHTFVDGLVVSCSSNGVVTQQYGNNKTLHVNKACASEKIRYIYGPGTVYKKNCDGTEQILFADGGVSCRESEVDEWEHLKTDPVGKGGHYKVESRKQRDTESDNVIITRSDGVVVVIMPDGSRITSHSDGTVMTSNADMSKVVVRKEEFAEVSVDTAVDCVARKHSSGDQVAITKGGICKRSTILFSDGTSTVLEYDTRVTAAVNGIIKTKTPGGSCIIATDDGKVNYTPCAADSVPSKADSGSYIFDCLNSCMTACDFEHNIFKVSLTLPKVSVVSDLAGEVSEELASKIGISPITAKAVVNDPIPPSVFILHGDGTGREILGSAQVVRFAQNHGKVLFKDQGADCIYAHPMLFKLKDSDAKKRFLDDEVDGSPKYFIRNLRPLPVQNATQISNVLESFEKWSQWDQNRKTQEIGCHCTDDRSPKEIEDEQYIQKKVLATYKAARARKKAERQKKKEAAISHSHLDVLQEEEGSDIDDDENDMEFGDSNSDADSRGDDLDYMDDNAYELSCTAFSDADSNNSGLINTKTARAALINALGYGVTANEVTSALIAEGEEPDAKLSFEVFSRVLAYFINHDTEAGLQDLQNRNSNGGDVVKDDRHEDEHVKNYWNENLKFTSAKNLTGQFQKREGIPDAEWIRRAFDRTMVFNYNLKVGILIRHKRRVDLEEEKREKSDENKYVKKRVSLIP